MLEHTTTNSILRLMSFFVARIVLDGPWSASSLRHVVSWLVFSFLRGLYGLYAQLEFGMNWNRRSSSAGGISVHKEKKHVANVT